MKTALEIWMTFVAACALWFVLGWYGAVYYSGSDPGGYGHSPAGAVVGSGPDDGTGN